MKTLDCDGSSRTLSQNGRSALRDIVQFVPFRKFHGRSYTALAEETLKEIPEQVEHFFYMKGIQPNAKREASARHFEMPVVEVVPLESQAAPEELPVAEMSLQG